MAKKFDKISPKNISEEKFNQLVDALPSSVIEQPKTVVTAPEKKEKIAIELESEAYAHPLVKEALVQFPAARIVNVISKEKLEQEAAIQALGEVDSEWDPFEED